MVFCLSHVQRHREIIMFWQHFQTPKSILSTCSIYWSQFPIQQALGSCRAFLHRPRLDRPTNSGDPLLARLSLWPRGASCSQPWSCWMRYLSLPAHQPLLLGSAVSSSSLPVPQSAETSAPPGWFPVPRPRHLGRTSAAWPWDGPNTVCPTKTKYSIHVLLSCPHISKLSWHVNYFCSIIALANTKQHFVPNALAWD